MSSSNLWDAVGETAKSVGGMALAPTGVVWDLATSPFDDVDDNFGTLVNKVAGRGADALDPILNDETLSGFAFTKVMQGLEWAKREVISEPGATALTMYGSLRYQNRDNPFGFEGFEDIFSGEKWGEAYEIAQNRSIGQAYVVADRADGGQEGPVLDPMNERAYSQYKKNAPFLSTLQSGAIDFGVSWYLDPGVALGKAVKVAKAAKTDRKITERDFDGDTLTAGDDFWAQSGIDKPNFNPFVSDDLGTRTRKYLDFIGTGAQGKPLNGAQVYVATPELRRSANGRQLAGLLADASRFEDKAMRDMAQKRVLAVAWGEGDAIKGVEDELAQIGAIGDALKNLAKGNVVDLKAHALGEQIVANPTLMASMQNQLDNLDDVGKFVDSHIKKMETLLDTSDTLKYAPGAHKTGKRALAREEGRGVLRNGELVMGPEAVKEPVNWTLERAARLREHVALSSVYQRSQSHMPLKVITHTASAVAKFSTLNYGRFPMQVGDALRTSHLQGFVSTHDWNGATNQLDSMLKLGAVAPGKRMDLLSRVQMARTETEKVTLIHEVEKETVRGLVAKHGIKREFGNHKELQDFIGEVMDKGQAKRSAHLTTLHGRAYAATQNADGMGRVDQITPRVDLIDEVDGVPVALPLLETQGRNHVPLFDAALADKMLDREYGTLMKQAQVWQEARKQVGALARLKESGGRVTEKQLRFYHSMMDHAVDAASFAMRTWKFSVLFRLGYPLRVISDDHMRIWSQMGAMAVVAPVFRESLGNVAYNKVTRYREISKEANQARVRLAEIDGLLSEGHVAAYADRAEQVTTLNRRITSGEWAMKRAADPAQAGKPGVPGSPERVTDLRDRAATLRDQRDILQQAMGDNPNDLLREREQIEKFLTLAKREQVKAKRKKRRGDKGVSIGGVEYPGAFGGDMGDAYRVASSSRATFDELAKVGEERLFKDTAGDGAWQVIHNDNPSHHVAWADALNNQFRQSKVAMFFVKNDDATVDDFVKWIKQSEQRDLRERLPHFAHDPEDWGWRIKQLVDDYLPTSALREQVSKGRVTPRALDRMFADKAALPAVHGATVANNLGMSRFATTAGQAMNKMYRFIGELPTDTLSRHPYFAALYEREVRTLHARKVRAAEKQGRVFGQKDVDAVVATARKNALNDVRTYLFDISAHSNAAHVMRFVSPFFAAHQEALARWWRIVSDDPSILRRFQQGFDAPRKLGMVVDSETGEPIKEGEMPGPGHSIMMQVPQNLGGGSRLGQVINEKMSGWRVNENSFNLILQNGVMNPGLGPIVQVPVEAVVQSQAQLEDLEKVARLINPYPPQSLGAMMMPATLRRLQTIIQKEKSPEYARMFAVNLQDKVVDFKLAHGDREPTQKELAQIERDARHETNTEAWLRFAQNSLSPAPASPRSKYEVFRQGWRRINDLAEVEGHDYDWRIEQFKAKYGEAYLPMIASSANNPGDLDATNETISALKKHRRIIDSVDIRFAGAIVGPAGKYQSAEDYSTTAGKWLRENVHRDSEDTFMSYDNPLAATREAAVKRGWNKYSQAMDVLNGLAHERGLQHYMQSEELMLLKRQIVTKLAGDNIHWGEDYTDFNPGEFNAQMDDLRMIVSDRSLKERDDVEVLGQYLQVRDLFTALLKRRDAAGGSASPDAKSNQDLMRKYRDIVAMLAERHLGFDEFWYQGIIERDPYLDEVFFKGDVN